MTTVLRASPRRFVSTPSVDRIVVRAIRYLQSGYSVHLRGPAGTGKTTLALHLADLLARPIMLIYGDDEFKTSDLIGNQSGYTRKKVVDNFIHSVVKVEDELRQNWVDSRLTLACREGFTLVYDEFNRSRPEVNNVLLSALEEKLLVLPPSNNRSEYIRVNSHFRAIFTSNPEEYVGVHATQDALLDRLITINMPEPDELTQQEILVQKTEIDRPGALLIVRLVKAFRTRTSSEKTSGLRSCLMLAKVCHEHGIAVNPGDSEFRDVCSDVLLSRASVSLQSATTALWELLNEAIGVGLGQSGLYESMYDVEPGALDLPPDSAPEWSAQEAVSTHFGAEVNAEELPPIIESVTEMLETEELAEAPVAEQPVVEALAAEELASEELPEELAAEERVAEELISEELAAEELISEELAAEELAAEELAAEELSEELAAEELAAEAPPLQLTEAIVSELLDFSHAVVPSPAPSPVTISPVEFGKAATKVEQVTSDLEAIAAELVDQPADVWEPSEDSALMEPASIEHEAPAPTCDEAILLHLAETGGARLSDIEQALGLDRFQTVDSLRVLIQQGKVEQSGDRRYQLIGGAS